jgi:hypothetical protein
MRQQKSLHMAAHNCCVFSASSTESMGEKRLGISLDIGKHWISEQTSLSEFDDRIRVEQQ